LILGKGPLGRPGRALLLRELLELSLDPRPEDVIRLMKPTVLIGATAQAGTFTKVMFPSLRLAYLVPPADLVEPLIKARCFVDRHSPTLPQAALADFMAGGHFSAHVRRMRSLYRERQQCLLEALDRRLAGRLRSRPDPAGMHLVAELQSTDDDLAIRDRCAARGVQLSPLSRYYLGAASKPGLLLGYTSPDRRQIEAGVEQLAAVLGQGSPGSDAGLLASASAR